MPEERGGRRIAVNALHFWRASFFLLQTEAFICSVRSASDVQSHVVSFFAEAEQLRGDGGQTKQTAVEEYKGELKDFLHKQ